MDHAGGACPLHSKSAFGEDFEHPVVIAQHVSLEFANASCASDAAQMLQQQGRDASPLMLIDNRKGNFGARRIGPTHITGVADKSLFSIMPQRRHQTDVIDKIEL